ncbi:MAG: hypothetical protein ABI415_02575 [Flavitalea sp.]
MKKLFLAFLALMMIQTASFSQTAPSKKSSHAKMATAKSDSVVLKKDGTPDKRYKKSAAAGPMKKDGTPDKRFKANKAK